jgi:hypothetical protein
MAGASNVRLGHALRGGADAVHEAVEIIRGDRALTARAPADPSAVSAAEEVLGVTAAARPIYAYLGDLNPSLGTVGLVIERAWLATLTGVSRCDSGGLGGRRGAFAELDHAEAMQALRDLTFADATLPAWSATFEQEILTSYLRQHSGYVDGDEPETSAWLHDVRARCIGHATPPRDRRLWTWEARLDAGPARLTSWR